MNNIIKRLILVLLIISFFTLPVGAALKIGILSDTDSVPLIVAREEGLFANTGAEIELVRFHNSIERDSALQAGVIDGAISDVLAASFAVDKGREVKITSLTNGSYQLVAAPVSDIKSYQDLKGIKIAVSKNTIIEYVTDRLLQENGLEEKDVTMVAIPKIPVRLQMLKAGRIKAACLPEPLASVVKLEGAREIGNSTELGEAPGILLFTQQALNEKGTEINDFYKAYSKAVELVNKAPDSYREILVTKGGFTSEIKGTFVFPVYDKPKLPETKTVQQVIDWLKDKDLLDNNITTRDLITDKFVK